jgi:hypothetical protein
MRNKVFKKFTKKKKTNELWNVFHVNFKVIDKI